MSQTIKFISFTNKAFMIIVSLELFSVQIIQQDKNKTHEGKNKTAKKMGEICMGRGMKFLVEL